MKHETRVGLVVLAEAVILGLAADLLFQGRPLGLNALLWAALFVGALLLLVRVARAPFHQGRRLMLAPVLVFAALLAWHTSPLLLVVNALALGAVVALGALRRSAPRVTQAPLADYAGGAAAAGTAALAGLIPIVHRDVDWADATRHGRRGPVAAAARGLAFGLPLLLVFGALFIAADAVFRDLAVSVLPSPHRPLVQLLFVVGFAWAGGGLLRDLAAPKDELRQLPPAALPTIRRPRIGLTEIAVALALLNALFLAFVLVQLRYLFGGRGLVEARTHLTYAEYARHGFFELVAVALLVLPLVLLADWTLRPGRRRDALIIRGLSAVLVALALVVMASALERMRLYEQTYGLTELRLYATGIILWLGAVFVWFALTVLRGRRDQFAAGTLVLGLAASLAMNVLSPDALIARTNLDRPKVDVQYVASLSDDAVPALVDRLPGLAPDLRRSLARELLARPLPAPDWRSWNASRSRARAVLVEHRAELQRYSR